MRRGESGGNEARGRDGDECKKGREKRDFFSVGMRLIRFFPGVALMEKWMDGKEKGEVRERVTMPGTSLRMVAA